MKNVTNVTLIKYFLVFMICALCGCSRVDVSAEQQEQLNEAPSKSGLHAKYATAGMSGISLHDPMEYELSGDSLGTIVNVVIKWRDQNHISSITSIRIQGPKSCVSVDLPRR